MEQRAGDRGAEPSTQWNWSTTADNLSNEVIEILRSQYAHSKAESQDGRTLVCSDQPRLVGTLMMVYNNNCNKQLLRGDFLEIS